MLLEGVGLELDPILTPLLDKRLRKISGSLSLEFGDALIDYNPEFKLYITTKLANPHFMPEVSTLVTVINFELTYNGLKD
jgi:dynein heavy chain